jgi:hypothetical protein
MNAFDNSPFINRFATVLLLGIVVVQVGCGTSKSRCAVEGQASVEAYLRTGADGAFTNVAVGGGAFTNYGTFLRLEGSGYGGAVWNIQGYDYIKLQRTAYYSGGSFPMMIYVTEGRATAPGLKTVGIPKIEFMSPVQGAFIYISHPGLR